MNNLLSTFIFKNVCIFLTFNYFFILTAILTKPDLIDKGTEKNILAIVHNKVIPLRKGYIMVKCRGQQQIDDKIPLEEAAEIERDFFQNHDYFRLKSEENLIYIFVPKNVCLQLT